VKGKPVFEIGIGDFYVESVRFLADVDGGNEPSLETVFVYIVCDLIPNFEPRVLFFFAFHLFPRDFHRNFHTCGKPS
jgi:hypothetical protein